MVEWDGVERLVEDWNKIKVFERVTVFKYRKEWNGLTKTLDGRKKICSSKIMTH